MSHERVDSPNTCRPRALVRSGGSLGCIGVGNGLATSFTLGCGTDGGSATTENVTYTHLRNVKRLAFPTA